MMTRRRLFQSAIAAGLVASVGPIAGAVPALAPGYAVKPHPGECLDRVLVGLARDLYGLPEGYGDDWPFRDQVRFWRPKVATALRYYRLKKRAVDRITARAMDWRIEPGAAHQWFLPPAAERIAA